MIGFITLGTNNLDRATDFYKTLLVGLGASRMFKYEKQAAWRFKESSTLLMISVPYDQQTATVGNGVMVALDVKDTATVDRLHTKACELGATDEGAPGLRGNSFYGAYFRDLDGNKLNFYCYT